MRAWMGGWFLPIDQWKVWVKPLLAVSHTVSQSQPDVFLQAMVSSLCRFGLLHGYKPGSCFSKAILSSCDTPNLPNAKLSSHQAWRQVHQQQCVLSWFSGKPAIPSRGPTDLSSSSSWSNITWDSPQSDPPAEYSMAGHRIFDATNPAASQKHCCKASTNSPFACASGAKLRAPCAWSCGGTLYWVPPNTSKQKQQTEVEIRDWKPQLNRDTLW